MQSGPVSNFMGQDTTRFMVLRPYPGKGTQANVGQWPHPQDYLRNSLGKLQPKKHEPSLRSDRADVECIVITAYKTLLHLCLLGCVDGEVSEPGKMLHHEGAAHPLACLHEACHDKTAARLHRGSLPHSLHAARSSRNYLEFRPWRPSSNDLRGGRVPSRR